MGYQGNFIAHLPGHLLYMTAAIFLALVSFNTPVLKSFYFLKATYSQGANAGEVSFGTLGYCFNRSGGEICTGPQIGYEIDLNSIFGIDGEGLIKIPAAIGKYLTYVLVLHIIALVSCVGAIVFRLIDTIDNVSLLCFPALLSWFTSACTFAAFIIDLAMFYIAKARIDSVDGASATIGVSVWFTLVAWVLPVFAGCFCGLGSVEKRRKPKAPRHEEQPPYPQSAGSYARVPGPPLNAFGEREVSVPLDTKNDLEGKKSEDDDPYRSTNHLGYSSNDQQYQPRRQPSSQGDRTYPPRRDPYSTGYYQEYGDGYDGRDGTAGDVGVGAGAGTFAGVGAGAGAASGGYGQYPIQPVYEQQAQPYTQQHGHDPYGNSSAYAYAPPDPQPQPISMPMPAARALSPQSQSTNNTVNRVDPYTNTGYIHDQVPYPSHDLHHQTQSDAYGGYETPNTARPMDNPAGYGQSYPPTQMQEGTPRFPTGVEPPSYALAADTTPQEQGQLARPRGSMDKSGGYSR